MAQIVRAERRREFRSLTKLGNNLPDTAFGQGAALTEKKKQQETKEYINPVELLRTLRQQVEALTYEVETLKGQMAQLLAERGSPPLPSS